MVSLKRFRVATLIATLFCCIELVFALPTSDFPQDIALDESQRPIRQTEAIASPCADIDWSQQAAGVQSVRNRQMTNGTSTEHCLILTPDVPRCIPEFSWQKVNGFNPMDMVIMPFSC